MLHLRYKHLQKRRLTLMKAGNRQECICLNVFIVYVFHISSLKTLRSNVRAVADWSSTMIGSPLGVLASDWMRANHSWAAVNKKRNRKFAHAFLVTLRKVT